MSRIHPIQVLIDEHEIIEQVLTAMEPLILRVETDPEAPRQLDRIFDFMQHFFEGCHHHKEELALFPLLRQKGFGGTANMLLDDHRTTNTYLASLRRALPLAVQGNAQALDFVKAEGLAYIALSREHLRQEEDILFELARQALTEKEIDEVDASFVAAEERHLSNAAYEKYVALAEELAATTVSRV